MHTAVSVSIQAHRLHHPRILSGELLSGTGKVHSFRCAVGPEYLTHVAWICHLYAVWLRPLLSAQLSCWGCGDSCNFRRNCACFEGFLKFHRPT